MNLNEFESLAKNSGHDQKYSKEDDLLWEKIEPQLPVSGRRRLLIFLLLGFTLVVLAGIGVWSYLGNFSDIPKNGSEEMQERNNLKSSQDILQNTSTSDQVKIETMQKSDAKLQADESLSSKYASIENRASDIQNQPNELDWKKKVILQNGKTKNENTSVEDYEISDTQITSKTEDSPIGNKNFVTKEQHLSINEVSGNDKLNIFLQNKNGANLVSGPIHTEVPELNSLSSKLLGKSYVTSQNTGSLNRARDIQPPVILPGEAKKTNIKRFAFSMEAGFHQQSNNFNIDSENPNQTLLDLKNEYESSSYGAQGSLLIDYKLNNAFLLRSGLTYKEYWTKVRRMETITDQILLKDQLLEIIINRSTQQPVDSTFGDTLVNRTRRYNLQQYAKYALVRVPIYLGYQWENRSGFYFEVFGGLGFNFWISRSGRTIDDEFNLVEIDDRQSKVVNPNRFLLSGQTGVSVGYHLSPVMSVYLRTEIEGTFNNWFDNSYGINYRPTDYGLVIGVSYRW